MGDSGAAAVAAAEAPQLLTFRHALHCPLLVYKQHRHVRQTGVKIMQRAKCEQHRYRVGEVALTKKE
jgi:hypothetical protein